MREHFGVGRSWGVERGPGDFVRNLEKKVRRDGVTMDYISGCHDGRNGLARAMYVWSRAPKVWNPQVEVAAC